MEKNINNTQFFTVEKEKTFAYNMLDCICS